MFGCPAESLVANAAIPFAEVKTDHRVYYNRTPFGVFSINCISYIEREEGFQASHFSMNVAAHKDRQKRSVVEIPLLSDAEAGAETEVRVHFFIDTGLNVETACFSSGDYRLEFKERTERHCR